MGHSWFVDPQRDHAIVLGVASAARRCGLVVSCVTVTGGGHWNGEKASVDPVLQGVVVPRTGGNVGYSLYDPQQPPQQWEKVSDKSEGKRPQIEGCDIVPVHNEAAGDGGGTGHGNGNLDCTLVDPFGIAP